MSLPSTAGLKRFLITFLAWLSWSTLSSPARAQKAVAPAPCAKVAAPPSPRTAPSNAVEDVKSALGAGKLTVASDAKKRPLTLTSGGAVVRIGYEGDTDRIVSLTIVKGKTTTVWKAGPRLLSGNAEWSDGKRKFLGYSAGGDGAIGISVKSRDGKEIVHAVLIGPKGVETLIDPATAAKEAAARKAKLDAVDEDERALQKKVALAEAKYRLAAAEAKLAKTKKALAMDDAKSKAVAPDFTKLATAGGLQIKVTYDAKNAVKEITFQEKGGEALTWKRTAGPDRANFSSYTSSKGDKLLGEINVWRKASVTPSGPRVVGAVDILDVRKKQSVTILPDGGLVVTDWAAGVQHKYDKDQKNVIVSVEGKDRVFWTAAAFKRDDKGFVEVTTPDGTFVRVGDPADARWAKRGSPKDVRTMSFALVRDRVVATEWKGKKRVVTEHVLNGPKPTAITFRPDDDAGDKVLDQRRWELVVRGVLPRDTTLSEFRDVYAIGIRTRFLALEKQLARYSSWMNRLRESRYKDSPGFKTAQAEFEELRAALNKLRKTAGDPVFVRGNLDLAKLDFAKFDAIDRASFYDPSDKDPAARGLPKLKKLLEAYKAELPGWDERGMAVAVGVGDGILAQGEGVFRSPVQSAGIVVLTIVAPEVMVPLLTAYGITNGARTISDGIAEMEKGERDKDAARYLRGWQRVGHGGTDVAIATGGYIAFLREAAVARRAAALETGPDALLTRTPTELRPVPEPFTSPKPPVPPEAVPAAAPAKSTLRFNPENAWGEIEWIAAALRLDETLKVRVGKPRKVKPKQLRGETAEAFEARRAADPDGAKAYQRAKENAARAEEYLSREFGDRVYKSGDKLPKDAKVLENSEVAATGTVVRALAENPARALAKMRGPVAGQPIPPAVRAFVDKALADVKPGQPILVIWNRGAATGFGADRAMTPELLTKLIAKAEEAGLRPVIVGDAIPQSVQRGTAIDMTGHWKKGVGSQGDQLLMFEYLQMRGAVGQVGMMSGGMDVPALSGMPTLSIHASGVSSRVGHVVGKLPGYKEVTPAAALELVGKLRGQKVPRVIIPYLPPPSEKK